MSSNLVFALLKREDVSDEQLLKTYVRHPLAGVRSFEILFDRYFNRVHAYLMVKGASTDAAEDLTQDIFVRIVSAAWNLRSGPGQFSGVAVQNRDEPVYRPSARDRQSAIRAAGGM